MDLIILGLGALLFLGLLIAELYGAVADIRDHLFKGKGARHREPGMARVTPSGTFPRHRYTEPAWAPGELAALRDDGDGIDVLGSGPVDTSTGELEVAR